MAAGSPQERALLAFPSGRRRAAPRPHGSLQLTPWAREPARGAGWGVGGGEGGAAWLPQQEPSGMDTQGQPERPHPVPRAASATTLTAVGQRARGRPGGGGGPARNQLPQSAMNEPARGRASLESPAMRPRCPQSGRADSVPRRAGRSGCTLQSAQRSLAELCKLRRAALRPAGPRGSAEPPEPRRWGRCMSQARGVRSGSRAGGRGAARPGRSSGPAGALHQEHGEGLGRGREGADSQVTPRSETGSL